MHQHEVEPIRKGLQKWDALVAEHALLVKCRDELKTMQPKNLKVRMESDNPQEPVVWVQLPLTVTKEMHDWLIERMTTEIAANVHQRERIDTPAGRDLHAKNGQKT